MEFNKIIKIFLLMFFLSQLLLVGYGASACDSIKDSCENRFGAGDNVCEVEFDKCIVQEKELYAQTSAQRSLFTTGGHMLVNILIGVAGMYGLGNMLLSLISQSKINSDETKGPQEKEQAQKSFKDSVKIFIIIIIIGALKGVFFGLF